MGRNRMKRRKHEKNNPKLPTSVPTSMTVGVYITQAEGRWLRWSDVTMMTNRSNHMPTLTRTAMASRRGGLTRTRRDHRSCGTSDVADDHRPECPRVWPRGAIQEYEAFVRICAVPGSEPFGRVGKGHDRAGKERDLRHAVQVIERDVAVQVHHAARDDEQQQHHAESRDTPRRQRSTAERSSCASQAGSTWRSPC